MFYYNQLDYKNVPYPRYNGDTATVASGGCGVCSALMVLNNLYGKEVMTVREMAEFSIDNGARISDGTDMSTLLAALSKKYAIKWESTEYNAKLLDCLKKGGMAVINQGDVYNVFSTSGHFVCGYKLANDKTIIVLDPYMYDGKYSKEPRKSRIVKQVGNEIYVTIDQVSKATQDRNPCYWLVWFTGKKNKPSIKAGQTVKLKCRAKLYNDCKATSGVRKIKDFSKFDCNAEAIIKSGAKIKCDKVVTTKNGNLWVYIEQYNGWVCVYDYKNDISKL